MDDKLLFCKDCNKVAYISPHDTAPEYRYDPETEEFVEEERDDSFQFLLVHKNHDMVQMEIDEISWWSDGRFSDPMKVTYYQANDGEHTYVVKRWREDAGKPYVYEIARGRMNVKFTEAEIFERDLVLQMAAEFASEGINQEKILFFVRTFKKIVRETPKEGFHVFPFETGYSDKQLAVLNADGHSRLLKECEGVFTQEEIRILKDFIACNNEFDDVMNVMLISQMDLEINPSVGGPKDAFLFDATMAFGQDK